MPDDAQAASVAAASVGDATTGSFATLDVPDVSIGAARLGGANRYETAVAIARRAFPAGAETVYLARSDIFADAIAAGSLSDGPVLLVPSCDTVPAAVHAEIDRVDPNEVVALGGTGSICETTLASAGAGRATDRLSGADRFDTAAQIAARAFPEGSDTVYLAEHRESADAVAGGSLTDGPVLLVANGSAGVPPQTSAAITALDPTSVVALGGTGAVT
jgi:putative cell wall-binding protein